MTDINAVATELNAQIVQSSTELKQLETIITRLMQVMTENGFQIAVDVAGLTRAVHQRLDAASKNGKLVQSQLGQMTGLLRTFSMISSSLELANVLNEVMDTVITLTGAERAYLVLRDKHTDQLDIAVARNWDRESLTEAEAGFSRSVVTEAIRQGQAIITTNAATDDRFQNVQSIVSNQLRSILCIPLIVRGEAQGVLYADNRISQNVFRQDEIPLLTAFGTQAAIAIENARQYGQVKEDLTRALNELQSLQIEIDRSKLERAVSQITETDYFQRISSSARSMRGRYKKSTPDE
ncbi:MAG: GAF domain-containing protein [Pleurocapsa minor GSE-CHR-MK-17-07R]|jgi:GAF domain-containing protein|nr:GAF domain-containing protein [Pleurocapsa minor GSE-CHR-MK 17-07R]